MCILYARESQECVPFHYFTLGRVPLIKGKEKAAYFFVLLDRQLGREVLSRVIALGLGVPRILIGIFALCGWRRATVKRRSLLARHSCNVTRAKSRPFLSFRDVIFPEESILSYPSAFSQSRSLNRTSLLGQIQRRKYWPVAPSIPTSRPTHPQFLRRSFPRDEDGFCDRPPPSKKGKENPSTSSSSFSSSVRRELATTTHFT